MADLGVYLDQLVEQRVEKILGPHMDALRRLSSFLGTATRRGPGRPPGTRLGRLSAGRGRNLPRSFRGDASKYKEGQQVRYRQGRGEFEAKVVKIDLAANSVTVQRETDGKKVVRPASKLYAA